VQSDDWCSSMLSFNPVIKWYCMCKNMSIHCYLEECCVRLNSSWWCSFSCSPNTESSPEADKSITKFFHGKGQLIMVKIISSQPFVCYIFIRKQFRADIHISAPYKITFKVAYIWHSTVAFIITHTHKFIYTIHTHIHTNSYTQYIHTHTQIHIHNTYTHTHKFLYYSHPQKFIQRRNSLMKF